MSIISITSKQQNKNHYIILLILDTLHHMKLLQYTKLIIAIIAATLVVDSYGSATSLLTPLEQHYRTTKLITHLLDKHHYKEFVIDNALSEKILDAYIRVLDPDRSYFHQLDITDFQMFRFSLDEALNRPGLDVPFQVFHRYRGRVNERVRYALDLLDNKFDFTINEELTMDRSELDWAADDTELNEIWRKRIKNEVLTLKLADKDFNEIRTTLEKRYQNIAKRTRNVKPEEVYQLFINAFTNTLDPHTNYLSPRNYDNFAIRMNLSLEGIGALLGTDGENILIRKIIPGGPADLSGLLHASDRIIGVAQQDEREFKDIVGWRLDDVVDLIRGAKDTVVKLQILPNEEGRTAKIREIQITRDKIKLEEQAAKSATIEIDEDHQTYKIGVIEIPTFYMDFTAYQRGDDNYRSTSQDVEHILMKLESENIDTLILDLRGNGGGSLTEAVQLAGLFIAEGPIVQVQGSNGHIKVHRDPDAGVAYQGPLVVLVDRFSASASEIVAGAIQDYQRGIVVGEPTFGKGTVQQLFDLTRLGSSRNTRLGQLKATTAQYFRINGDSTQHRGIIPDIEFHTPFTYQEYGERSLKNALPWSSISPVNHYYGTIDAQIIADMSELHRSRIAKNEKFTSLIDLLRFDDEVKDQTTVSLLEAIRKKEHDQITSTRSTYRNLLQSTKNLNTPDEEKQYVDALLDETAHIAADLSRLLKSRGSGSFANRVH